MLGFAVCVFCFVVLGKGHFAEVEGQSELLDSIYEEREWRNRCFDQSFSTVSDPLNEKLRMFAFDRYGPVVCHR